ncbi:MULTISPECIES: o-succinylbenzoate synthase [Vagococcus]|uniref:Multifunctional fusion protein n=1 Tax=Vagococcus fluvialis bH819 TaxID=1255619 RepID=A0A1X6WNB0_9ENTE|nr:MULTISPECIES: o-succinylbenzoate synthase [Vagococcus]SLM85757.1 O-succinylbenzoate synthase [Vagococcus fluvialis bH819]HCM90179.1 o-succinylbenzoate synthase [Vagococcus sp.]
MLTIKTTVGTYAIHYLNSQKKNQKTLICLHGFMGDHTTFDFLKNKTDWNIIGIDLLGHGQSEQSTHAENYQLYRIANALEEIFNELKLEQIYLLGYSFGGRVAQTYAYHYPKRVVHLFLESASIGLRNEKEKELRKNSDQKLAEKLNQMGMTSFVDWWQDDPLFASQKLLPQSIVSKEITTKKKQNVQSMILSLLSGSVANQEFFLKTDLFDNIPTTFIAGSLDQKYVQIGQQLKKEKNIPIVVIESVGHCVHLETPDYFYDILYAVIEDKRIEIKDVYAYEHSLDLLTPFRTSYGELTQKKTDIFVIESFNKTNGYGELLSFEAPDYIEETLENDRLIIKNYLIPLLKKQVLYSPRQIRDLFLPVKGNQMAKAALETAIWDLFAKERKISLAEYIGLPNKPISVGVSIGIQKDEATLLKVVKEYVQQGYTRIKIKINKGKDISYIRNVREAFPDLIIMVDANSAYHLSDEKLLKQFDNFSLAMIEQPLGTSDFYEHALLQKKINTPICLDENIRSLSDVKLAHTLGSCQSINLKIPRVGGLTECLDILEYTHNTNLSIWIGGMLESGVGRSLNLIIANHPSFTLPGDLSASNRYYKEDVIIEEFSLKRGRMRALESDGIGVTLKEVDRKKINYWF